MYLHCNVFAIVKAPALRRYTTSHAIFFAFYVSENIVLAVLADDDRHRMEAGHSFGQSLQADEARTDARRGRQRDRRDRSGLLLVEVSGWRRGGITE